MANPRIEELPDEPETAANDKKDGPKKAEAEDASDSSGSVVEGGEGGEGAALPVHDAPPCRSTINYPTTTRARRCWKRGTTKRPC